MGTEKTKKRTLFFHVGYPKTATTTLQQHFFPNIDGIDFFGKTGKKSTVFSRHDISRLVHAEEQLCRMEQGRLTNKVLAAMRHDCGLLSQETILGSTVTPRLGPYGLWHHTSAPATARAIRNCLDPEQFEVNILITIRKQTEVLPSKYAQSYLREYSRVRALDSFDKFLNDILHNDRSFLRIGYDYAETVRAFEEVFGDSVCIVPFELVFHDQSKYLQLFLDHLGSRCHAESFLPLPRENATGEKRDNLFSLLVTLKRRIFKDRALVPHNKAVFDYLRRITLPWQRRAVTMNDDQRAAIHQLYAPSNRALDEKYGLGLGELGYY